MHWANRDAVRPSDVDGGLPNDWRCGDAGDEISGDVVAMMSDVWCMMSDGGDDVWWSGDVVAVMPDEVPGDEVMPDGDDDDNDDTSRDLFAWSLLSRHMAPITARTKKVGEALKWGPFFLNVSLESGKIFLTTSVRRRINGINIGI